MVKQIRIFLAWGILVFASASISLVSAQGRPTAQEKQPLNVQLTSKAWDEFNRNNYSGAMEAADKCIDEFLGAAEREQAKLVKARTPLPPTGAVSERDKKVIMASGLLNDVATCFYIKARSAENRRSTDQTSEAEKRRLPGQAKEAYQACSRLTYGRTWDPQGWFWSPSEVCSDRLRKLK